MDAGESRVRALGADLTRPPAVAGTWYPATAGALSREVDAHLAQAPAWRHGQIRALIAPHAGLMFSGPVGAHAYKAAAAQAHEVVVLVGPSHRAAFDGVALYPKGAFASPLGAALVEPAGSQALTAFPVIRALPQVHLGEHSLEMQLPFLRRLLPEVPIVPLLIGRQTRETILALGRALAGAFQGRAALLVASTDLSHYFDADTAQGLDARVLSRIQAFDPEGLLDLFEQYPEGERGRHVACGGGALIAVMHAARALGATGARILHYAHSGEISGDRDCVVGYVAAVLGCFAADELAPAKDHAPSC